MTTRRQFVHRGIAASVVSFAGARMGLVSVRGSGSSTHSKEPLSPASSWSISELVVDRQISEGRAFAAWPDRLDGRVRALDVTEVWRDDLYHHWLPDAVIAGLTGISALFCLEQLGRRYDRRVLLRIDHQPRADGRIEHLFKGPATQRVLAVRALARPDWASGLAQLAWQCPMGAKDIEQSSVGITTGPHDDWIEPLVTWLIVPRALTIPS